VSDLDENERLSRESSDDNQNVKELEEIKEHIYKIRKLTKHKTPSTFAGGSSFHQRARSKYMNDYIRQDSRTFREDTSNKPRSRSAMRNSNAMLTGGSEDQYLQTETASQNANSNNLASAMPRHIQTPRSTSNHFFRSGSEYRSMVGNSGSVVRASSKDRKIEPKSTWEPNEQG